MLEKSTVFPQSKPRKNPEHSVALPDESIPPVVGVPFKKNEPGKFRPHPMDLAKVALPGKNTARLRKAFELCIKYDGDLNRAAKEAGYSVAGHTSMQRLIKSKSWQQLINIYFPVVKLFEVGSQLLNHPDWRAQDKQLDRIHKMRGDFNRKVENKVNPHGSMGEKTNEELQAIIDGDVEIVDDRQADDGSGDDGFVNNDEEREGPDDNFVNGNDDTNV